MLRLAILRHAKAFAHAPGGDAARPLTVGGHKDASLMGARMLALKIVPELALVSTAVRTRETFAGVAAGLGRSINAIFEPALYAADTRALETMLSRTQVGIATLLIVGHNPSLAELANLLAGSGDAAARAEMRGYFPPPCLAVVDFQCDTWAEVAPGAGHLAYFITREALTT